MQKWFAGALLLAMAGSVNGQDLPPAPGLPLSVRLPAINSIRPGEVAVRPLPNDTPAELTVYVSNYNETLGGLEILWNGSPLSSTASSTHPESRFVAQVPAENLRREGSAIVTARLGGRIESNGVIVEIRDTPKSCDDEAPPECDAALGEIPAIEMVPVHAWHPFVRAPAGGLVLLRNRDFAARFGNHRVTRTTIQHRVPLSEQLFGPPEPVPEQDRFDVRVDSPRAGSTGAIEAYLRIPENDEAGSTILFYCAQHENAMEPPFGGIVVE